MDAVPDIKPIKTKQYDVPESKINKLGSCHSDPSYSAQAVAVRLFYYRI